MIPVKKITITRAEGPTIKCGKPHEFPSFIQASAWLWNQAYTFPKLGYDKHDFKVEFEDGETYEGRLDCKHFSCTDPDLDIYQHLLSTCRWCAGREPYPHCGMEKYKAWMAQEDPATIQSYGEFIDKYLVEVPT